MYKKISVVLAVIMIMLAAIPALALEDIQGEMPPNLEDYDYRYYINGDYYDFMLEPVEKGEKVLIPLREILEKLEYQLNWNKGKIEIKKGDSKKEINTYNSDLELKNIDGRIYIEEKFFKDFEDFDISYDNVNKTFIINKYPIEKKDVYNFDLGERVVYEEASGRDIKYRLQGGISMPETNKNPLVIILHGANSVNNSSYNRYDLGYSYLIKELVDAGYGAITLNVGIHYSFEDGEPMGRDRIQSVFEETIKAIEAGDEGFKFNVKEKVDLDNVILIGHSRSGQEILKIAERYEDSNRINIRGLLSIAPSRVYEMDYSTVDLPTSIILPELDGDVIYLDGQWIFDEYMSLDNRKSESQVVYLYGANHNAFNKALLKRDEGLHWFEGDKEPISAEEQRSFLIDYSIKFIDIVLNNKSLYEELGTKDLEILGHKALVSNYIPGEKIYDENVELKNIKSKNLDLKKLDLGFDNEVENVKEGILFNHPGTREELPVLNIKIKDRDNYIDIPLDKLDKKDILGIYWAQDSTDEVNNGKKFNIKLELLGKSGVLSSIKYSEPVTLMHQKGEPIFENTAFSGHTPLGILNVPVKDFNIKNLEEVETLRISFTDVEEGSIMLRYIFKSKINN